MEVFIISHGGIMKSIASSMVLIGIIWIALHLYNFIWLNSERLRRNLRKQGIKGPPPSFLYGNVLEMHKIQLSSTTKRFHKDGHDDQFIGHDYTFSLFPYFEHWREKYGRVYTYSTGIKQHVYVNDPDLVKEMNQTTTLDLGKPSYVSKKLAPMLGNGILRSNGLLWAHHRKIVAPQFFMDKVKGMVELMVESVQPMLQKWEEKVESTGGLVADVRVDEDLRGVSAEVISRACFGSSYFKGKLIFSKLRILQKVISNQGFLFSLPNFGFLAVKKQSEIRSLEKEIEMLIWEAVKERRQLVRENDLMQSILDGAIENNDDNNENVDTYESSKSFIVDNCKNIYFAGHEATAIAASWCLMLLAQHPEWQARIRTEVAQVLQNGLPDANSVSQMKMVTMVIQETLRLYPPAAFVSREALEETRLGHITIPKGVCLWTLIPTLHRDPVIWGPDSNEFKPERFANGISKACKFPQAYIPFGLGPRLCLGRNFAMVELKIVLSLIISKFEFSLSPLYRHSPAYRMIVEPEHGVFIRVKLHPAISE